ncbi:putative beta keto-acyl synthase [Magnetofaba australis IT-1]|uniref:Putative beta keto-acyl synthase n=1 Tax=Magnetofaba australis IT-1 TaxID=1434232 RepID=A0A1Y2KBX8_9PROT|nr:putative beta keto-acyl synthase [Magnetofaba australis IT-1]
MAAGEDLISDAPPGSWRLPPESLIKPGADLRGEGIWTQRGGYVRDFEKLFDPSGLAVPEERLRALDPVCQWSVQAARAALSEAVGVDPATQRVGLILGNLSYPSRGLTDYALQVWRGEDGPIAPENRFNSGFPALIAAQALGLSGEAFALDAACASSLYAIQLACERLAARQCDALLVGAVNAADPMMIFMGFTQLQALSRSGQSRPFHRHADGLLPAEGAVCIALKRLDDAIAHGDRIFGVIRGVGLSNDGRRGGVLAPDSEGQQRAMQAAYDLSGVDPASIGLMECHATGTAVGDAVEIRSMLPLFGARDDLPIGSLKSNMGHLITASGLASLLKILGAFEAHTLPPTLHAEQPLTELAGTPFRPLAEAEPWPEAAEGPRRAAINNFGFGGNNAHLIVEEWRGVETASSTFAPPEVASECSDDADIAICGIAVMTGSAQSFAQFQQQLQAKPPTDGPVESLFGVSLPMAGQAVTPRDLQAALPQQNAMLAAAIDAMAGVAPAAPERSGVFVGMGCDAEIARYSQRWLLRDADAKTRDSIIPALDAAGVVGAMPNMPANRIHAHFDWRGPGMTVSAEELSGVSALKIACRMLRAGTLDLALAGAVDLAHEPVQSAAVRALLHAVRHVMGDGAVAFVLKRAEDARRAGDPIYALLPNLPDDAPSQSCAELDLHDADAPSAVTARFGHAHAASGLLHLAAGVAALQAAQRPVAAQTEESLLVSDDEPLVVTLSDMIGQQQRVALAAGEPLLNEAVAATPILRLFAAPDRAALRVCIAEGEESVGASADPARMAWVCDDAAQDAALRQQALAYLDGESDRLPQAIHFAQQPLGGELAFVFTGAAAACGGMDDGMARAFPDMRAALARQNPYLESLLSLTQPQNQARCPQPDPLTQLKISSLWSQQHAWLARNLLGLRPQAALGLSSGESNSLFAFGVWRDMAQMFADIDASQIYGRWLTGPCVSAARAWGLPESASIVWRNWRLLAPLEEVQQAVARQERVSISIIQSPQDCCIGGDEAACLAVVREIGASRAFPLGQDMVAHCAELEPVADIWRSVHLRQTHPPADGVRIYSNSSNTHYSPDTHSAADAITRQATTPVDFRQTVENAYADGVRIFLEMGPRTALSHAINQTLGERTHLALAMDNAAGDPLRQLASVAAQLFVAGVELHAEPLMRRLQLSWEQAQLRDSAAKQPRLRLPAHRAAVTLNALSQEANEPAQSMPPAPALSLPPHWAPIAPRCAPLPVAAPALNASSPATPPSKAEAIRMAWEPIREQHARYLEQQAQAQQQFLTLQAAIAQQWFGRGGGASTSAVQSPVAVAPPVALVTQTVTPSAVEADAAPSVAKGRETTAPSLSDAPIPEGPRFTRQELQTLASGRISTVFGAQFAPQDDYIRQVRLPEPPLLLVDRVTGLKGEPGAMGLGTIWTETDIDNHPWSLHQGRASLGTLIESGQSDLLLISWLGADFHNRDERVYRLLGCECTFHRAGLPGAGDTLSYDIHVDGHAHSGAVRLFFFHYDCRVEGGLRLSVRSGQAGFFTDAELAASKGVLWSAEEDAPQPDARLDAPPQLSAKRAFSAEELDGWRNGDAYGCFGGGFELAGAHLRTPTIASGRMKLLDSVSAFDPSGGPWGRGYLCANAHVPTDAWFYAGHFKNDPCMPGTLMADAAIQALAITMGAMGFTIRRDGWRFEPVADEPFTFVCRGQVIPDAPHDLRYEVFIEEVIDGPEPRVYAALLCSSDDLKVFLCRRFGLQLVHDTPFDPALIPADPSARHWLDAARTIPGDYPAILSCAQGSYVQACGPAFADYDGPWRRMPRLPSPPFLYITRIDSVDALQGTPKRGARVVTHFEIPAQNHPLIASHSSASAPFAMLLEALLQPCGWLCVYLGFATHEQKDYKLRNLDGDDCILHQETWPAFGSLRCETVLTDFVMTASSRLAFFRIDGYVGKQLVMSLQTNFGLFLPEQLEHQRGLPTTDAQREAMQRPGDLFYDLQHAPEALPSGPALAREPLNMVDRVTLFEADGGEQGLGCIRGEQTVDPRAWYFSVHFYEDPVQPGSLGLEALVQLLQTFMRLKGLHDGFAQPRFQSLATESPFSWRYRGQVVPTHDLVVTELSITAIERQPGRVTATASGSLWVDGLRIYEARDLTMAIVEGDPPQPLKEIASESAAPSGATHRARFGFDLQSQPWLRSHCPTYVVPALPMTVLADLMAQTAQPLFRELKLVALEDLQALRWSIIPEGARITLEGVATVSEAGHSADVEIRLLEDGEDGDSAKPVARGRALFAADYPAPCAPLLPLVDAPSIADPYVDRSVFHGPAFQIMSGLRRNREGATFQLNAGSQAVPQGVVNPLLLDGIFHGPPRDEPHLWFPGAAVEETSFPTHVARIQFFAPPVMDGVVDCEVRAAGQEGRHLHFTAQLQRQGQPLLEMRYTEITFHKGFMAAFSARDRAAFLERGEPLSGASLSTILADGATELASAEVMRNNRLPGTLEALYRVSGTVAEITEAIAIKEHVARGAGVHPREVEIADAHSAWVARMPLNRFPYAAQRQGRSVIVRDGAGDTLHWPVLQQAWRTRLRLDGPWLGETLFVAMARQWVGRVVLVDPAALTALRGKPALFVANHQVGVESILFAILAQALHGGDLVTLAKVEHRDSWLGRLLSVCQAFPGVTLPQTIYFFDREQRESLFDCLKQVREAMMQRGASLMVHVEGTRSRQCRQPVTQLSGVLIDFALEAGIPIVPLRFVGGLPVAPVAESLEFAPGFARQDIYLGAPLAAEELRKLPLVERKARVLDALNGLGPDLMTETPHTPNEAFAQRVAQRQQGQGVEFVRAALLQALAEFPQLGEHERALLTALERGGTIPGETEQAAWLRELQGWFQQGVAGYSRLNPE